jgi:DNA-binding NarL/FixJ family response regulator
MEEDSSETAHSAGIPILEWTMPGVKKLRVLVVDDTTLMRQGIKSLLEQRDTIEVVGEVANPQAVTELTDGLVPDVVLLDQDMPGFDTVQAIKLVKARLPQVEVIVLAETPDDTTAFRALEAGASGYVLKDTDADNLFQAVDGVCTGRTIMNSRVARQLVDRFRTLVHERNGHNQLDVGGLTARELEILFEITKGATDREIAREMCVSTTTVKSHIRSILRKLGARNRTQAVAYMLQNGHPLSRAHGPHE